jgi:hypothetical protein
MATDGRNKAHSSRARGADMLTNPDAQTPRRALVLYTAARGICDARLSEERLSEERLISASKVDEASTANQS